MQTTMALLQEAMARYEGTVAQLMEDDKYADRAERMVTRWAGQRIPVTQRSTTQGDVLRYLPEQRYHNSITWPTALPPGSYTAILTIVYGDSQVHTQDFPFTIAK